VIVGLGTDVLAVARMAASLADPGLRDTVFTPDEVAYCESMRHPAQHYAARFAAKEALFKALAADGQDGMRWREVEVRREPSGRPTLALSGATRVLAERLAVDGVFVTLTHTSEHAAATVVLETRGAPGGERRAG